MGYPYEDLSDGQFEALVVQIMRRLFGLGVESFAQGPDGGRDARFRGTAERFPSTASAWSGSTIGQAKHTAAVNTHVSDPDFGGEADSSIITKEIPRIEALVEAKDLDNYILFTNRRVGAGVGTAIRQRIADATGLPLERIFLAGIEFLDDMLREYPEVIRLAQIDPVDSPLTVYSFDIAEVIIAIAEALDAEDPAEDAPVVQRVSLSEKNTLNGMSEELSRMLTRRYMSLTDQIERFLAAPGNSDALRRYEAAVDDFQVKIIARRKDYQSFDDVFNYLVDLLLKRDPVLSRNRQLTRAMVFYMYWHCDIGETPDAVAT